MWSAKFGKNKYEYGQHTSLYEEVGSKYGLDRGDSIDRRNVQHLGKRDYIRRLNKDIRQSEKAIKGLKTMLENLEKQIVERQEKLMSLDVKLNNGKINLQEYEEVKNGLKWQITELQNKVYDKTVALGRKESELKKLTKEVDAVSSVIQPFRNHKVEFDPPRITEKPPL
ncbi:MAG: recombinase, partial [Paludibacteraceae bacterium]|nr:recombinase [Paludibacteraceae bacterium]